MNREEILRTNRRVYDAMAAAQNPLCRPAKDDDLRNPLKTVDLAGWLGKSIQGKNLLCLAAGGGRQSSLYAAAGANVTVVDLSPGMLELDRQVARERGHSIRLFEGSMDDLCMLKSGEFDVVIHPVSTCYVPDVQPVFNEVARVTRIGGVYISQHKQAISLQASIEPGFAGKYTIEHPYKCDSPITGSLPPCPLAHRLRESGAAEFVHTLEQLLGGICRAGFLISAVAEPDHTRDDSEQPFSRRATYIPPYLRVRAIRWSSVNEPLGPLTQP